MACLPSVPSEAFFACGAGGPCDASAARDVDDSGGLSDGTGGDVEELAPDGAFDAGDVHTLDAGNLPMCDSSTSTLVCDDFEAPAVDRARWSFLGQGALVDNFAHRGARSVQLTPPAPDGTKWMIAEIRTSTSLPMGAMERLFIRAWFFISPPPAGGTSVAIIRVLSASPEIFDVRVDTSRTKLWSFVTNTRRDNTTSPPEFGKWSCYELGIVLTGTTGTSLSRDDQVLLPFAKAKTVGSLPIAKVALGSYTEPSVPQPPIWVWVDDVIIADHPIGCAR